MVEDKDVPFVVIPAGAKIDSGGSNIGSLYVGETLLLKRDLLKARQEKEELQKKFDVQEQNLASAKRDLKHFQDLKNEYKMKFELYQEVYQDLLETVLKLKKRGQDD